MEKAGAKTRDFTFYSPKNQAMVRVHSKFARDYAKHLEEQSWVEAYEPGKALELERLPHINPVGIRKLYFQTPWCSDFYIRCADGRTEVRKLVSSASLQQLAMVEKLELSRRYWTAMEVGWKVVLV